jgi:YesN/AraC family two-component response regulator
LEYSVLIIDDDVWMQRILSKTLSAYGFKNSYLASNGFDGIALAVEHNPHLIILDILMPDLTGHLTLRILKTIKSTKNIPVIMVSALSDVENLGRAVKSGTAGFISKPFTRATVYDKLVDVFGKEKLDKIGKGEDILGDEEYYTSHFEKAIEKDKQDKAEYFEKEITGNDDQSKEEEKEKKEKLLKHYNEDEKRSIESIKKMLLKSKK